MSDIQLKLPHVMDDVLVPSAGEFGYVFAVSEETEMALIKGYDGRTIGWEHFDALTPLMREAVGQ